MADEDFVEEEVWSYVKDGSPSATNRRTKDHSFLSPSSSSSSYNSKRLPSSSRLIPRSNANAEEHGENHRQSAPVNIPDWSKIYKHKSSLDGGNGDHNANDDDDDDEFDDDGGDRVPPHEWIAKKLARSQISSFSVCEGAGRTLKGRDQRKVRNAVLTKTGFLELVDHGVHFPPLTNATTIGRWIPPLKASSSKRTDPQDLKCGAPCSLNLQHSQEAKMIYEYAP